MTTKALARLVGIAPTATIRDLFVQNRAPTEECQAVRSSPKLAVARRNVNGKVLSAVAKRRNVNFRKKNGGQPDFLALTRMTTNSRGCRKELSFTKEPIAQKSVPIITPTRSKGPKAGFEIQILICSN